VSPVAPSRTRKRDTVTQIIPYIALPKHTARDRHMGDTQPLWFAERRVSLNKIPHHHSPYSIHIAVLVRLTAQWWGWKLDRVIQLKKIN
jgi:hypothetical protein